MNRERFRGGLGSWRAALRIARREALRARGRTALVLAMITLPVLALAFVAVSADMAELTRAERFDRRLGTADAELRWVTENPVTQDAWGEGYWARQGDAVTRTRPVDAAELAALLPAGSRLTEVRWWVPLDVRVGDRNETFPARALDLTDPLARSLVRLRAGRVPSAPDEIMLSEPARDRLDAHIGGTVRTADGSRTYRLVGVVEFPDDLREVAALHPDAPGPPREASDASWLVDLPGPVDAALVDRLNRHGVTIGGREPAPGTEAPRDGSRVALPDAETAGNAVLIGGLGLLEVVLLAGPAFAVGVRRRRRDLALVAVAGGDAVHLRRIVLADGLVLGGAGAALGLLLGVAAAVAGRPLVEQYVLQARSGGYRVFPVALVAIGAVAVLAGLLAALAPACTAARQDVVDGLSGRRTAPPHRRRWLVVGVALTGLGAATAAVGAQRGGQLVILTGLILGELGLVCTTPTLIGLLARAGRMLPLSPRIALRDASRNRSSAAPAISAVMAAVAGSVAIGAYVASDDARARADWLPGMPPGHVLLTPSEPTGREPLPATSAIADVVRAELAGAGVARLDVPVCAAPRQPGDYCVVEAVVPPDRMCPYDAETSGSPEVRRRALADPRCLAPARGPDGIYLPTVVDDGSVLPGLTGAPTQEVAAAAAVLRAGGAVVTDPRLVVDGRVTLSASRLGESPEVRAQVTRTIPGYVLRGGLPVDRLVLSAAAAGQLDLAAEPTGYVVDTAAPPSVAQRNRLSAALRPVASLALDVQREEPASDQRPLLLLLAVGSGVITVGAAGVATGLAAAEGRRDLSTLAAVGASPRVRRMLSLCQAGVIAGLGSVLGIVAGLGTALIILTSFNRQYARSWPVESPYPLVMPWPTLGVLVLVPLVAMLGAALFTRSRLAVERRLD